MSMELERDTRVILNIDWAPSVFFDPTSDGVLSGESECYRKLLGNENGNGPGVVPNLADDIPNPSVAPESSPRSGRRHKARGERCSANPGKQIAIYSKVREAADGS